MLDLIYGLDGSVCCWMMLMRMLVHRLGAVVGNCHVVRLTDIQALFKKRRSN